MFILRTALLGAGLAVGLSGSAIADPKPSGAKAANAQLVANLYGGKTHNWKGCKGGIYYGPNWEAQAWCEKDGPAVGIGKWSISKRGDLCSELTWYWPSGSDVGSKPGEKECVSHVVDGDGQMWRSWPKDKDWWPAQVSTDKKNGTVNGFRFKSKVNRLRRKLGV